MENPWLVLGGAAPPTFGRCCSGRRAASPCYPDREKEIFILSLLEEHIYARMMDLRRAGAVDRLRPEGQKGYTAPIAILNCIS